MAKKKRISSGQRSGKTAAASYIALQVNGTLAGNKSFMTIFILSTVTFKGLEELLISVIYYIETPSTVVEKQSILSECQW